MPTLPDYSEVSPAHMSTNLPDKIADLFIFFYSSVSGAYNYIYQISSLTRLFRRYNAKLAILMVYISHKASCNVLYKAIPITGM